MLTVEEIKMFIDEDAASVKKHFARIGERYFDGDHDIKNYRIYCIRLMVMIILILIHLVSCHSSGWIITRNRSAI